MALRHTLENQLERSGWTSAPAVVGVVAAVPHVGHSSGNISISTSLPKSILGNDDFELFQVDSSDISNLSVTDQLGRNETQIFTHFQKNSLKSLETDLQTWSTHYPPELVGDTQVLQNETYEATKLQEIIKSIYKNQNTSLSFNNASLKNVPGKMYSQQVDSFKNFFGIDKNSTDGSGENETMLEQPQSTTFTSDTRLDRVWEKGILKRKVLNIFLNYFRACMIVPVSIGAMSVVLTVAVFKRKTFVYKGKPLVISFNIFEGFKSVSYLIFRVVKLYIGDTKITWNSWYGQFFIYYIMWLPISLGRIGFLHNGLITLYRFFTIAFPLRRFNKQLVAYPKVCIAIIVVSMFAYQSAPMVLFFRDVEPRLDYQKTFRNDEIISEIYVVNPEAFAVYWRVLIIGDVLFVYIPLLLALIFNVLILISLWRHKKMVQATLKNNTGGAVSRAVSKNQAVKRQTNTTIVVSSLIFAVLVLFRRLLPLVSLFVKDFGEGRREMHLYILLNDIFIVFDCLSPLANIISYTSLSSEFRRRLKEILFSNFNTSGQSPSSKSNKSNESTR